MDEETQGGAQATAAPPEPAGPAPDQGGAQADWLKAAQSQAKAPVAQTPAPQQSGVMPEQPAQQGPVVVSSLKRGGLLGVVDSIADVLAGKQRPELGKDSDGNLYVKQHDLTRGEQWMKIAGEAIHGAAAGYAAGQGAGNQGKAGIAGWQAGQQDADRQKQQGQDIQGQVDHQKLEQANNQMLQMKLAEHAWNQTRSEAKATQEDTDWENKEGDALKAGNAQFLGTTMHAGDIDHIVAAHPDVMKSLVGYKGAEQDLQFVPHYVDGKAAGFNVYRTTPGFLDEVLPQGSTFMTWDPIKQQYQDNAASGNITRRQQMQYNMAAYVEKSKDLTAQAELENKRATTANLQSETKERDLAAPGKRAETASTTAKNYDEAAAARAKAAQVKSGALTPDGIPNPRFEEMAQAMERGDILPADLKREAKGAGLDPNEIVGRAAEIAHANGRQFSLPIIEQEHTFAKNPKTQAALDGIDRVIGSPGAQGYIDQMLDTARQAKLAAGPGAGAFNNIALATKRYLGDNAARQLQTRIMDTRRSIAGLIGNPLLGGSETDQKLKQADEMLGQSPTMENLEGSSKILKQALETQKQSIVQNNRYLRARYGTAGAQPAPQAAQPQAAQATPQTHAWSASAWQQANPQGDVNAAKAAALKQGYQVNP